MSFLARIIADSISPVGHRITTVEATYPRIVHAEVMTHRVFARNSASTRAIALIAQLQNLLFNPFIPEEFGINKSGMQAVNILMGRKHDEAVKIWLDGRDRALTTFVELILGRKVAGEVLGYNTISGHHFACAKDIEKHLQEIIDLVPDTKEEFDPEATDLLNVHKQLAGRGLEAYMWHTVVITATEWDNFFGLRVHPDAQGEIAKIAALIKREREASVPVELDYGQWHTPFVEPGEFSNIEDAVKASVSRAAATSYNRQNNKNPEAQLKLYNRLLGGGHMSPFEHQATPFSREERTLRANLQSHIPDINEFMDLGIDKLALSQMKQSLEFNGNLRGWTSHRKQIMFEDDFGKLRATRA